MGAGGYKSWDYVKVGTPLTIIILAVLVLMVPIFFPFNTDVTHFDFSSIYAAFRVSRLITHLWRGIDPLSVLGRFNVLFLLALLVG